VQLAAGARGRHRHLPCAILHRLITTNSKRGPASARPARSFAEKRRRWSSNLTDWGYQYAGIRPLDEGRTCTSAPINFVMPFHQIRPYQTHKGGVAVAGHICRCRWTTGPRWSTTGTTAPRNQPLDDDDRAERRSGNGPSHVDQTTFRSRANRREQLPPGSPGAEDRDVHRDRRINTQDRGIQESMDPVVDRSKEHLGPADKAIIQARRLLLGAVKTVQQGGTPRGVEPSYYALRAAEGGARDAELAEILTPETARAAILQTV